MNIKFLPLELISNSPIIEHNNIFARLFLWRQWTINSKLGVSTTEFGLFTAKTLSFNIKIDYIHNWTWSFHIKIGSVYNRTCSFYIKIGSIHSRTWSFHNQDWFCSQHDWACSQKEWACSRQDWTCSQQDCTLWCNTLSSAFFFHPSLGNPL